MSVVRKYLVDKIFCLFGDTNFYYNREPLIKFFKDIKIDLIIIDKFYCLLGEYETFASNFNEKELKRYMANLRISLINDELPIPIKFKMESYQKIYIYALAVVNLILDINTFSLEHSTSQFEKLLNLDPKLCNIIMNYDYGICHTSSVTVRKRAILSNINILPSILYLYDYYSNFKIERILTNNMVNIHKIVSLSNELIIVAFENRLNFWNLITGQCENSIVAHSNKINFLYALPPNYLITGNIDTTKIWKKGKLKHTIKNKLLCISPNGKIIVNMDSNIGIWNLHGQCERVIENKFPIELLAFIQNDKIVITHHKSIKLLWNNIIIEQDIPIKYMITYKNKIIIANFGLLQVYDSETTELEKYFNFRDTITSLLVLEYPNGKYDVVTAGDKLRIWDRIIFGKWTLITHMSLTPNNKILIGSEEGELLIVNPMTGNVDHILKGHMSSIHTSHILNDKRLITGSDSGTVIIWG